MGRIRTIKPEFFVDDDIAALQPLTRLLFIGMWTLADRDGRLEDRPAKIKVQLLAYDDIDVDKALTDLERGRFITRYQADGRKLIQIRTFEKNQKVHHSEPEGKFQPNEDFVKLTENGDSPFQDGENQFQDGENLSGKERNCIKGKERKGKEVCVEKERKGSGEGKPPSAEKPHTPSENLLKSFQELETAIRSRLPEMIQLYGISDFAIKTFASEWLSRKKITDDWAKYTPKAMLNFFVIDAIEKLNPNPPGFSGRIAQG